MAIVGFNFTKMVAEKTGNPTGKVSIGNNISIENVKQVDINLGAKGSNGLLLNFNYSCNYGPSLGKINLQGELVTVESAEKVKECIESWKKNKTIDKAIMQQAMAFVLNKCTIQAIIISRDLALPAPVPLPKLDQKNNSEAKKEEKKK
jgi:hypothetical protein